MQEAATHTYKTEDPKCMYITYPCSYVINLLQHIWNGVHSICGTGVLRVKVLQEQVLKHFPALKEELRSLVANCQREESHLHVAARRKRNNGRWRSGGRQRVERKEMVGRRDGRRDVMICTISANKETHQSSCTVRPKHPPSLDKYPPPKNTKVNPFLGIWIWCPCTWRRKKIQ